MYVNPAFTALLGIEREELYNNPRLWMARVHEDDRALVERTFAAWVLGTPSEGYEIEYRIVIRDGSIHWVRDVVSGLFDSQGALCGSSGILEDITEQKAYASGSRICLEELRVPFTERTAMALR
jgi:PAS domain S-box-containing protein